MDEISSDGYPAPISTDASSPTFYLQPNDQSNSNIGISPLISPPLITGRHRRLPPTPRQRPVRRCSSPRFLPKPPAVLSCDSLQPISNLERRPSTGRRLPQPPVDKSVITAEIRDNSNDKTVASSTSKNNEWPSPTIIQRKFSDLRKDSSSGDATSTAGLFGTATGSNSAQKSPQQSSFQQQPKLRSPLEHSNGTSSSTNAQSQCSSQSPSIEQLANSDVEEPMVHDADLSLYQQIAATSSSSVPDITRRSLVPTSSSWPESEPKPAGLGLLHCSLQHFPVRKRLRVSLLKAEGLAGKLKPELEIHAFCKVSLTPGGKSQSSIVRRGRDVVFNQEFFFDNISLEDLNEKCLAIAVCHQSMQKLQKDIIIGDLYVPLRDLHELRSKKEVRIIEELKHRINPKKLGKLHVTSCLETEARRLTINIIKVEDLPKGGITGSPDVCVRVRLTQGDVSQTKQSRVIKGTCNAVYKEAIMFLVKTKAAELRNTDIIISVHDLSRSVTGDDLIGSAFLGKLAMDKSEQEQWKNTLEHAGKEFKGIHLLKAPIQRPDVHATEAPSDSD